MRSLGVAARRVADRLLRGGLERLHGTGPVLVPEYSLRLKARWGWDGPVLDAVARQLARDTDGYRPLLDGACELAEWAATIPRAPTPQSPFWENDWWGSVDALVQCAALKRRNPRLYLEVGSGFSTLFARRAIEDFALGTRVVSIDPRPRADVGGCCDEAIRRGVDQLDLVIFDRLGAGDILLVDGSHTALMNSDSTVLVLEVLPRLAPGVLVCFDDVFLPWDYPPTWAGRIYGEQYLLAAMLIAGAGSFEVRFPGWWLVECSGLSGELESVWPIVENRFGRHATSFWIETS